MIKIQRNKMKKPTNKIVLMELLRNPKLDFESSDHLYKTIWNIYITIKPYSNHFLKYKHMNILGLAIWKFTCYLPTCTRYCRTFMYYQDFFILSFWNISHWTLYERISTMRQLIQYDDFVLHVIWIMYVYQLLRLS